MNTRLVLIHGRSQENKDAVALKKDWLQALDTGLGKSQLALEVPDTRIAFPYYGQTLFDLVGNAATVAEVIVRGESGEDKAEQAFQQALLQEMQHAAGIPDEEIEAVINDEVLQRGVLNWEWVQGILKVFDRRVPGASDASIALFTRDVYHYLKNPVVRRKIDDGVKAAMQPGVPTVVVSHSLGTMVAYNLLRREGKALGWQVPLFVTLGSPLAAQAIKSSVAPIVHPSCVGRWFNAMDERDVVALYPLTRRHFAVDPEIENKTDVDNHTRNRHGIAGYLDDADVARIIHKALN